MATSAAQLAANRQNAQFSTGPKSPEGKARSSANATTHGLTAKHPPAENPNYARLARELESELNPKGALQRVIFDQIVHAAWILNQAKALFTNPDTAPESLERITLYIRRAERSFYRGLHELKSLQNEARHRAQHHTTAESVLVNTRREVPQPPHRPTPPPPPPPPPQQPETVLRT